MTSRHPQMTISPCAKSTPATNPATRGTLARTSGQARGLRAHMPPPGSHQLAQMILKFRRPRSGRSYWISTKRSLAVAQIGHGSGTSSRTVLPQTGQTNIFAAAKSLPAFSADAACLYSPW